MIVALVIYNLLILVRNVLTGLRGVPEEAKEAATGMGFGPARRILRVDLPLALPSIAAGTRVATVNTVALVTIGFAVGHGGLGSIITQGYRNNPLPAGSHDGHRPGRRAGAGAGPAAAARAAAAHPLATGGGGVSVWEFLTTSASWQGEDGITHRLWQHVWISTASVLVACLIALPVGILLGHVGRGGVVAVNLANAGRAIPTLGIIVLFAVSPLGLNTATLIATLVIFAIPPILANAFVGVSTVDRDAKESARGMGLSGGQVLRRVEVPLALPLMAAGVRTSAVQVVATATLAGYTGFGTLGQLVFRGFVVNLSYLVIGGAVLVAILALLTEVLLAIVQRLVTPAGLRIGQRGQVRDASQLARPPRQVSATTSG